MVIYNRISERFSDLCTGTSQRDTDYRRSRCSGSGIWIGGISAAITAGREGMKTLLVEQGGDVGGIATAGLMSHWTGHTEGGIYEEILERSCECTGTDAAGQEGMDFNGDERQIINPEKLKTVFLEMLVEAGVDLRLYTMASDPIMDGDTIRGVILQSKNGREAVLANSAIDATGTEI